MGNYQYKTEPFAHQAEAFDISKDREFFALLADMGTGKSKITIDNFSYLYLHGKIQLVIIIAPNGVYNNWILNEIPKHTPDCINYKAVAWRSTQNKAKKLELESLFDVALSGGLPILSLNVEAFQSNLAKNKAFQFCLRLINGLETFIAVDESTRIKKSSSKRTRSITKLGHRCTYRRILTGQPVAQTPLDLYSQYKFLHPDILGYQTNAGFRSDYANIIKELNARASEKAKREVFYEKITGYKNLDKLKQKIIPHSFRVKFQDCKLNLPERIFIERPIDLNKEQQRMYKEMRDDFIAFIEPIIKEDKNATTARKEMNDDEFLSFIMLEESLGEKIQARGGGAKRIKMHQILGGFIKSEDAQWLQVGKTVPRMEDLLATTEEINGKLIVWAWFRGEIEAISQALADKYGSETVGTYYGGIGQEKQFEIIDKFQDEKRILNQHGEIIGVEKEVSPLRFFVGNASTGGIGITLTNCNHSYYYNRDYLLESKNQSLARNNRIGSTGKHTVYIDAYAPNTVEKYLMDGHETMNKIADELMDF